MAKKREIEVRFLGPQHRLEMFGQLVERGATAMFTKAEVFALRAYDNFQIEVLDAQTGAGTSEPEAKMARGASTEQSDKKE